MTIQYKIIIPFTLLFLLALGTVAFISANTLAGHVEEKQIKHSQDVLRAVSGLPVNDATMKHLESVLGAKLLVLSQPADRVIYPSGLSSGNVLLALSLREENGAIISSKRQIILNNEAYIPASLLRREKSGGEILVALIPVKDLAEAKWTAARPIALVAIFGALFVVCAGILIGRAISRPVRELAAATRDITLGKNPPFATRSDDEIGDLARAFDSMLESLRAAQEKIVLAEKLSVLGKVSAGMAHEIKNPLAAIKMTVQVLRRRAEKQNDDLEPYDQIISEIDRLAMYVNELLDYARPRPLASAPLKIPGVLDDVLSVLERQLTHSHVAVRREYAPDLPAITAEENRLKQVFMNLALNALQAMAPSGTLTVRVIRQENFVQIDVEDSAGRLSPEDTEQVFEPFFSTKEGGTGLGLALSKRIVEEHGGTISATVTPGERTTFSIRLPLIVNENRKG